MYMYVSFTCPSILESKHPCSFRNYNYICRIRPLFKLLRKKWTFREPSFMFFCRNISSFPSWQYTTAHITLTFISSTWEREKKTITMLYCIRICFFFSRTNSNSCPFASMTPRTYGSRQQNQHDTSCFRNIITDK